MRFYQACVEVINNDGYHYWNNLDRPKLSHTEAEDDIKYYVMCKEGGYNGYRKGAPGRTRIDEFNED